MTKPTKLELTWIGKENQPRLEPRILIEDTLFFPLTARDGTKVFPMRKDGAEGRWRWGKDRTEEDAHLIEWVKGRAGWTPYYRIYGDTESKRPPETIWPHGEVGSNRTSKAELKAIFGGVKSFETPKPEGLLQRVIALATNEGDWVLDSFAGSGTTGAVAHKMGRRWIMVELGEHCHTHIIARLKKVVDGKDLGGVTEAVGWKVGGGFCYYRLAPSLLQKDQFGNWVINRKYNAAMLGEAICKLEGFLTPPATRSTGSTAARPRRTSSTSRRRRSPASRSRSSPTRWARDGACSLCAGRSASRTSMRSRI